MSTDIILPGQEPAVDAQIFRPSAAIDPNRLEYLWKLAERIALSGLVPETLRTEGRANSKTDLPFEEIHANVFAVVEQADRWNISPFALLSCAAMVHGKLGFEGKVIAAVLEANYGIKLYAYYTGDPRSDDLRIYLCDEKLPADIVAALKPDYRHPYFRIMDGVVSEWKTTGAGTPWRPATYQKMMVYRGTREWARVYKAVAILGVLADDELDQIEITQRSNSARSVALEGRFGGSRSEGFTPDGVKQLGHAGDQSMPMVHTGSAEAEKLRANSTAAGGSATPASQVSREAGSGGADSKEQRRPEAKGGDKPFRLTAEQYFEYASQLARMGSVATVEKASGKFWEKHGAPATGSAEYELTFRIYQQQIARAEGKIEANGLLDSIQNEIDAAMEAAS